MARTVILVDRDNRQIGTADLLEAHASPGKLHRAFSVYVFTRGKLELLIQQRSKEKLLWPGIWANTCCSHPFEGEGTIAAGQRRLQEEMGFVVNLIEGPSFVYQAEDPNGHGAEHEHVTTLLAEVPRNFDIHANPSEVQAWQWIEVQKLLREFTDKPNLYAPWLKTGLKKILNLPTTS
jgi:isopentenyl-diphosphate delta-isomerase